MMRFKLNTTKISEPRDPFGPFSVELSAQLNGGFKAYTCHCREISDRLLMAQSDDMDSSSLWAGTGRRENKIFAPCEYPL
jgi:hypothetical protein